MQNPEPTINNADLWSEYFRKEWGRWPFGTQEVADGAGARVAGFLALVAAGPIAWLYSSNATYVPRLSVVEPTGEAAPTASPEEPLQQEAAASAA